MKAQILLFTRSRSHRIWNNEVQSQTHDAVSRLFPCVFHGLFVSRCRLLYGSSLDSSTIQVQLPFLVLKISTWDVSDPVQPSTAGGTWKAHQHDHADGLLQAQRITQLFIFCFYIGFLMPPSCDSHRAQTARCAMCLPNIGNLAGKPTDSCHLL